MAIKIKDNDETAFYNLANSYEDLEIRDKAILNY
jgi:hypothetical protein